MAFKINRQQNEEVNNNPMCDCETTDAQNPEVVATHGWVFKKLGEFKAMLCKFENILGTKLWRVDDVVSEHIMANKFILIDDNGNKMELKIKDGNISV